MTVFVAQQRRYISNDDGNDEVNAGHDGEGSDHVMIVILGMMVLNRDGDAMVMAVNDGSEW